MPSWKKVITSGSSAALSSLTVTTNVTAQSFTGSLSGSATTTVSASYAATASLAPLYVATAATTSMLAPYVPNSRTGSFAITGSNRFNGDQTVTGSITATVNVVAAGNIEAQTNLKSMNQAGDEGGEIFLNAPATNTTIPGGVTIDVYQNRLRFFEQGGSANGYFLDMPSGAPGVGTDLAPSGYTGTVTIFGNPPGQQNLNYTNGILISVT